MSAEVTRLARAFAGVLAEWLTPEELAEIDRQNATAAPGVCHSHDVCDANEAMGEAFKRLYGRDPAPGSSEDAALWGEAWDIARLGGFAAPRGGAS